jgi:hypothetical protein
MPINELLASELTYVQKLVTGNNLTGLRTAKDFIPKAIASFQRRLDQLRSTELLMLQKLRRELTMQQVDGIRADFYMKDAPMQSFLKYDPDISDPHEYLVYDLNKMKNLPVGIQEMITTQKTMATEIKELIAAIRDLNDQLEDVNNLIAAKNGADVAMVKDQIAQRNIAEAYALYELYLLFKKNTRAVDGTEGYTCDQKIIRMLEMIQQKFMSFAERNPFVMNGSVVLDLVNPGNDANGTALTALIENLRKSTDPIDAMVVDAKVQKYIDDLTKNINNPNIAKDVIRRTTSLNTPAPTDAMSSKTASAPSMVQYTQKAVNWWTQWDGKNFAEKATEWFRWRVSGLYGGMPFCDSTSQSPEQSQRATTVSTQTATSMTAAQQQATAASAAGVNTTATQTPYVPAGAPTPVAAPAVAPKPIFSDALITVSGSSFLNKDPGDITEDDLVGGYRQWKTWTGTDLQLTANYNAEEYKQALMDYRTSHNNQIPIPQTWWDNPLGPPPSTASTPIYNNLKGTNLPSTTVWHR